MLENWNKTLNHMLDLRRHVLYHMVKLQCALECSCDPAGSLCNSTPSALTGHTCLSDSELRLQLHLCSAALGICLPILHPPAACMLQSNHNKMSRCVLIIRNMQGSQQMCQRHLANTDTALCTDSRQIPTSGYFPVTPINLWTFPLPPPPPKFVAAC